MFVKSPHFGHSKAEYIQITCNFNRWVSKSWRKKLERYWQILSLILIIQDYNLVSCHWKNPMKAARCQLWISDMIKEFKMFFKTFWQGWQKHQKNLSLQYAIPPSLEKGWQTRIQTSKNHHLPLAWTGKWAIHAFTKGLAKVLPRQQPPLALLCIAGLSTYPSPNLPKKEELCSVHSLFITCWEPGGRSELSSTSCCCLPAASLSVTTTNASHAAWWLPSCSWVPLAVCSGGNKDQNLLSRDCGRELGLCTIWEKSDHRTKPLRGQVSLW